MLLHEMYEYTDRLTAPFQPKSVAHLAIVRQGSRVENWAKVTDCMFATRSRSQFANELQKQYNYFNTNTIHALFPPPSSTEVKQLTELAKQTI